MSDTRLVIEVKNYWGLSDIHWTIPYGLSFVVGGNGAGKSTLLNALDILRTVIYYGNRALTWQSLGVQPQALFSVSVGDLRWAFETGLALQITERLTQGTQVIARQNDTEDLIGSLIRRLENCHIYRDYDLAIIREGTASAHLADDEAYLYQKGQNLFAVLRAWRSCQQDREEFVVKSFQECFGFDRIEYEKNDDGLIEGCFVPRRSLRIPASQAASGWLTALLHFTAVAGAQRGAVIAIDGFETGLHPRTQISAIQAIDEYASAAGISVVLTTQSPTVLDWIDRPERVFVLDHGRGPKPLIDLKTCEWLAQFRLGHGFSQGDYGNG